MCNASVGCTACSQGWTKSHFFELTRALVTGTMAQGEAEKLWKEAEKLTSPSLLSFRLKSDWEQAGPLYEKAAGFFRVAIRS